MPSNQLMPTRAAAAWLGVSHQHVAYMVRTGQLTPAFQAPGLRGAYMFERDHIEQIARERKAKEAQR